MTRNTVAPGESVNPGMKAVVAGVEQSDIKSSIDVSWCDEKIKLQREIGMTSAMGIIIGSIIGSGIFMAPVAIVKQCNSVGLSLVVWVVSGVVSIGKSMCFIELGMLFPVAGGEYAYMREINGETMAFLNAYVTMIAVRPCALAMITKMTVDYFSDAFMPGCQHNQFARNMLAAWLLVTIVTINSMSMKYIAMVQSMLSAMKIGALLLVIVTGFIYIAQGNTENFKEPFKDSNFSVINIAVGIYAGIYSYDGWQSIYDLMEDIKKPEKVAPKTSVASILVIIVLYLGTNVAYFSTMTPDEMSRSSAVAMSFAKVTMGSYSKIIPILVGCSTIGALNSSIMSGSRNLFAQSRDQLFPDLACLLQVKYKVPWMSSWSICILTCIYLFQFNIFELFDYLNFTSFFFNIFLYGNVIILRYTRPNLHRPFKCNLLIPFCIVTLIIFMAVSGAIKSPFNFMVSQIQVACGLPLYAFVRYINNNPKFMYDFRYKINSTIQKLMLLAYPVKG